MATLMPKTIGVYRLFGTHLGTDFFTNSAAEKATIDATRADLTAEGIG